MLTRVWSNRKSHLLLVGMQNNTTHLEDRQFLTKLSNILLPYGLTIMLLDIYPRELKIYIHTKTYTQMFVA